MLCKAAWIHLVFSFISFCFLGVHLVNVTAFTQLLIFRFLALVRWTKTMKPSIFTIIYFIMIHALIQYNTVINKQIQLLMYTLLNT